MSLDESERFVLRFRWVLLVLSGRLPTIILGSLPPHKKRREKKHCQN